MVTVLATAAEHGGEAAASAGGGGAMEMAFVVPVIAMASAALIWAIGKRFPRRGAEIGVGAMVAVLLGSLLVFFDTIRHIGADPDFHGFERAVTWMNFGPDSTLELGFHVDGLTAVLMVVVGFVALMVHLYAASYMKGDVRVTHFFATLSLFTASMLNLVLANNMLQMLLGWEGMGICSYLLIGHWWEKHENSSAAIKAFLTTRVGDVGFMFGIFVLFWAARSFNVAQINEMAAAGDIARGTLTVAAVLLFCGAIGKSAQFPLHTWLPDAMAGPTPVSALIHAATMVVAGVYLVARMFPVFDNASDIALDEVAIIGSITMVIAALLALVQQDLKRVLAYSTISQLAYMIGGLGVGAYTASVFHIWTHAWFKALLFLGAGSVIHAVHSNNMTDMGGLFKKMPITSITFIIGGLALAAFPPFAGFWSKDELVTGAYEAATHGSTAGMITFIAMMLTAFLTACYVARMLALTFFGAPKYDEKHVHPHESPRLMTYPLIALAVLAVAGGWVGIPGDLNQFGTWVHYGEEHAAFNPMIAIASTGLALAGFAVGWAIFRLGRVKVDLQRTALAPFYRLLLNKYYLDEIYFRGIVRPVRDGLSRAAYWVNQHVLDGVVNAAGIVAVKSGTFAYRDVDQGLIDGLVNNLARFAGLAGDKLKFWQTGNMQRYAAAMFLGVATLVGAFAFFRF
ncbi:MAG TPA: NADH-quinone oxidoreductase subunit L [Actinomycetota bacterium]|nr:NADH-quinone oxidoreductase subunit L [Actinomycetota bacterium]